MPGKQVISKAVGIDLGTTNSAVALMDPADKEVIIHRDPNTRGETTPSCVWKNPKTNEIVVGRLAVRRIGTMPQPIRSVKRLMGQQTTVRMTDEDVTPELASAAILAEMKRQIEDDVAQLSTDSTTWEVDRAIVTVPAHFDQPQIEATKKAADLADLSVLDLLHEPTAAACYHCWRTSTQNGTFLVYDFGGGTFDVSVLRARAGVFDVLAISGNTWLGGDDLDTAIAEDLRERMVRDGWALDLKPGDDEEDALRWALLRRMAETVKIGLSNAGEFLLRDAMGLRDQEDLRVDPVEVMFQRADVEHLVRPVIERTIPYCFDALEQAEARAGMKLADVDAIVLAGGSTHVPLVRTIVRENLCSIVNGEVQLADERANQPRARCTEPVYENVDSIVARGAAIRAAAAGGLAVTNEERTVRVLFRGVGATGAQETHVGGKVEALAPDVDLTDGTVKVTIPEVDFEDEQPLGEGGTFAFRRLPLQSSAENLLNFEVRDRSGEVVATAGRPVTQDREARPMRGGAPVLAKAISLEVSKDGAPVRRPLFEAISQLPSEGTFPFLHPGDVEEVRLPIYQGKRMIKEIKVPVPSSLPKGTPVTVKVFIDDLAMITVQGSIGDTQFDAKVEAPPERNVPGPDEAASLDRTFTEGLAYLPTGQQNVQRLKYERAKKSYEGATARGDTDAARHDFEEMEDVVSALSAIEGPLQPPKAYVDALVKDCYDLHRYIESISANLTEPYEGAEITRTIEAQREEAERAFTASNQQAYSEAIAMLQRILDHLRKVAASTGGGGGGQDPEQTPEEEAAELLQYARARSARLRGMAAERPDLLQQIDQVDTFLAQAAGEVQRNARAVQQRARQALQTLERLENQLQGAARRTVDGGLVIDASVDQKA